MWISGGRPVKQEGAAEAEALGRERVWRGREAPRRPVLLEQSE